MKVKFQTGAPSKNISSCRNTLFTGKSIDFERHATAPEILMVLTVGFDPICYFVGGFNFFKLANEKFTGFSFFMIYITCYSMAIISMCLQLLLCSIDIV